MTLTVFSCLRNLSLSLSLSLFDQIFTIFYRQDLSIFTAPREDLLWFLYHFLKGLFFITAQIGNRRKIYILSAVQLPTNWDILCYILYRHAMYWHALPWPTLACSNSWLTLTLCNTDRVELLHTHNRENKGRNQGKLLKSPWTLSLHLLNIMKSCKTGVMIGFGRRKVSRVFRTYFYTGARGYIYISIFDSKGWHWCGEYS